MNIKIEMLQGGAPISQLDANLFEDTFLRADQPFRVGDQWDVMGDPNDVQGYTDAQLSGMMNVALGSGLTVTNNTGGNFVPRVYCIPRPISWTRVQAQNQFAEYVCTADNSVGGSLTRFGPMVLCNPNLGTTYLLALNREIPFQLELIRWAAGASTILFTSAASVWAFNDTITVTATINTADVTLDVMVNGVVLTTVVDNNVARLTTGLPGIFCQGASAGRTQTMTNFRCGALSRL